MAFPEDSSWNVDVSKLTPGGWLVALVSCGVAVASMFACMRMLDPKVHALMPGTAWMLIGLAAGFAVSFVVGAIILRLCGLTLTKDKD